MANYWYKSHMTSIVKNPVPLSFTLMKSTIIQLYCIHGRNTIQDMYEHALVRSGRTGNGWGGVGIVYTGLKCTASVESIKPRVILAAAVLTKATMPM